MLPLLTIILSGCDEPEPPPQPRRTVVVISWDTTRADALGCYADTNHWGGSLPAHLHPRPVTPVADQLAEGGVRFQWAFASAPTTLSSHTTLFSGLDQYSHRVVRNGYPVPDDVPLLAEALQTAGWQTLAVVGSSALESAMGLSRGFSVYDDPGPQPEGGMYMRSASDVTARALAAVDARSDRDADLFLFVHYYDPHSPWFTAPPALVSQIAPPGYSGHVDGSMASIGRLTEARHSGRMLVDDVVQARALYLAQVAWVDQQTGVLIKGLSDRGLTEDALVVLLSDHGESLDEHERYPYSHGPDVDLMNVQVPLIMRGTGSLALTRGAVVKRPVRLQDVGSTLLTLLEPDADNLGRGEFLGPLWVGQSMPAIPIFAEATKPIPAESQRAWNNLPFERSVVFDGAMLVKNPLAGESATLYAMAPGQPPITDPQLATRLEFLLDGWTASSPAHRGVAMSGTTEAALRSLGYLEPEESEESEESEQPAPQ
jgi:arylsulfatase A-like enzyme